jgi:hypothetical protein
VVPGYLFLSGYTSGRQYRAPLTDLEGLARLVVVSLAWLSIDWAGGPLRSLITWAHHDRLGQHESSVAVITITSVFVPYVLGLLIGALIVRAYEDKTRVIFRIADGLGAYRPVGPWERMVAEIRAVGRPALLRVRLQDKSELLVGYGAKSWIGLSPRPRDAFFEKEYAPDGTSIASPYGIFIQADQIETVSIELFF